MEQGVADPECITLRVGECALHWIDLHLDRFDPLHDRAEPDTENLKSLIELAVLCTNLMRGGPFQADSRIPRFLDLIQATYDHASFREWVFRTGKGFVPYTLLAIALRRNGALSEADRRGLQHLVDHGNVAVTEQVPHRMLDLRHMLDAAGLAHQLPSYARLYRDTTLARGINPISASAFDAYSITHTMFYLTDWGAHPPAAIPKSHRARLAWLLEQMLGMAIREGDWDLSGEFLLACHCLGKTDSPLYALGWQALANAQWPDGAMPGPGYSETRAAEQDEASAADYVFRSCCHTTLVAAFAGAICVPPVLS